MWKGVRDFGKNANDLSGILCIYDQESRRAQGGVPGGGGVPGLFTFCSAFVHAFTHCAALQWPSIICN